MTDTRDQHCQVWCAPANAYVDEGVRELVEALCAFGVHTVESCQGRRGSADAFVCFKAGGWLMAAAFARSLCIAVESVDGAHVEVESRIGSTGASAREPMCWLGAPCEVLHELIAALKDARAETLA